MLLRMNNVVARNQIERDLERLAEMEKQGRTDASLYGAAEEMLRSTLSLLGGTVAQRGKP